MTAASTIQETNTTTSPPIDLNTNKTKKMKTRFGEIEFVETQKVDMLQGPIGFADGKRFIFTKLPQDKKNMYILMQSLDDEEISFITLPVNMQTAPYRIEDLEKIYHECEVKPENALWLTIVNMQKEEGKVAVYANFGAPILVDSSTLRGWQHILPNPAYEVRKKIF